MARFNANKSFFIYAVSSEAKVSVCFKVGLKSISFLCLKREEPLESSTKLRVGQS